MRFLSLLNPPGRLRRWAIKLAFLFVVTLLVLYPKPWMLVVHIDRGLHMPALIEPDAIGVEPLAAKVLAGAGATIDRKSQLRAVEAVVYEALPYQYDWDNWGVANYFPTAAEAIARGRCDCKGRAVVAASILARLGFQPRLVSDLSHVWVWTAEGEAMGPVRTVSGRRLIDADAGGQRLDLGALLSRGGVLVDLPARLGFSIYAFPPLRTALITAAVWVVALRESPRWSLAGTAAVLLAAGLALLARSSPSPERTNILGLWSGLVVLAAGLVLARARSPMPNEKARLHAAAGPLDSVDSKRRPPSGKPS